jgi:hypothetical protein
MPLYKQVGQLLGEANCVQSLGDVELIERNADTAKVKFEYALTLYQKIPAPYSMGWALARLARLSDGETQTALAAKARAAWASIDRPDLVAMLQREFGVG